MKYLIAMDLEGMHGVVGERYMGLMRQCSDYKNATEAATLEVNTAIRALFDAGADTVAVWDNHGGGGNIDFNEVDSRAVRVDVSNDSYRYEFVKNFGFDGVIFLGYHAKEGTPRGVLAHTFSSVDIQYVKLNGVAIGELAVDTYICTAHGIAPLFLAADDVAIEEMRGIRPDIAAVMTKRAINRNEAELFERERVLDEIYRGVIDAVKNVSRDFSYPFPADARLEVRYTRAEKAADVMKRAEMLGIPAVYGEDTHVLHFDISDATQIPKLL